MITWVLPFNTVIYCSLSLVINLTAMRSLSPSNIHFGKMLLDEIQGLSDILVILSNSFLLHNIIKKSIIPSCKMGLVLWKMSWFLSSHFCLISFDFFLFTLKFIDRVLDTRTDTVTTKHLFCKEIFCISNFNSSKNLYRQNIFPQNTFIWAVMLHSDDMANTKTSPLFY